MSDRAFLLNRYVSKREYFDPANEQHLKQLAYFVKNGRWQNGCPFYLEQPYLEIPAMCSNRFLEHSLASY
jgi:hypothetical protein